MTNTEKALYRYVERVERLEDEMAGLRDDAKEIYAEMKSEGFDPAAVKRAIAARKNWQAYSERRKKTDAVLDALDAVDLQKKQESLESAQ